MQGELARIPVKNFSYISRFLFTDSILRVEMLIVVVRGEFSGFSCPENISVGRGIFMRRCCQISWHCLKKDEKLNKKKIFQLKLRSNIKT